MGGWVSYLDAAAGRVGVEQADLVLAGDGAELTGDAGDWEGRVCGWVGE